MYKVTCAYDGKPAHFTLQLNNAIDAVNSYNSFIDWLAATAQGLAQDMEGMANEYSTVNLLEPSGKMHTKVFYREK